MLSFMAYKLSHKCVISHVILSEAKDLTNVRAGLLARGLRSAQNDNTIYEMASRPVGEDNTACCCEPNSELSNRFTNSQTVLGIATGG